MDIELRGVPINKINVENDQYSIIRVGTEGCVHKFCECLEALLNSDCMNQIIHLVSPRIPNKYMDRVIDYLEKVREQYNVESIVVNDYGLLYRMKTLGMKYQEIILGRTLVRSLAYTPWSNYIIRDEGDSIKENLLAANIFHKSKIEFFRQYNITGVELCSSPLLKETIEMVHENNIKAYVHLNTIIATIGRTCPIVRMKETSVGECQHLCNECYKVKLNKVWGVNKFMYQEPTQQIKDLIPDYLVKENVVYYKCNEMQSQELADVCIIDYMLNKEEEIDSVNQMS